MSIMSRAARAAIVVIAGTVGVASTAAGQKHPRIGYAASPPPPPPQISTPYPGATVTIDPRLYQLQSARPPRSPQRRTRVVYVAVPVPYGSAYYPGAGYGGGVTDANGRPLAASFDAPEPDRYGYGLGTPDLAGAPYLAIEGGDMVVDFGRGEKRIFPSCAAATSARTPDGQARTVFYRPGSEGLILRPGQRGRIRGVPAADESACYTTDRYGRMALESLP